MIINRDEKTTWIENIIDHIQFCEDEILSGWKVKTSTIIHTPLRPYCSGLNTVHTILDFVVSFQMAMSSILILKGEKVSNPQ